MSTSVNPAFEDSNELFDLSQARLWLGFVVRSFRRHWKRSLATFLAVMVAAVLYAFTREKLYYAQTVISVDDRVQIEQGASSNSQSTSADDRRARLEAKSTVYSTSNIRSIIDQTKLVSHYQSNPSRLSKMIFGKKSESARQEELVDLLESRIKVDQSTEDKQITISVLWNNAVDAEALVVATQNNFLSDRRTQELGEAQEALKINRAYAEEARKAAEVKRQELGNPRELEGAVADITRLRTLLEREANAEKVLDESRRAFTASQTAFNYKYKVIRPAERPKAPVSSRIKYLVLGLVGALMLAALVACLGDIVRGRFMEPWQVSKRMNLPVLAQLH